jgi:hypothetical protein
MFEQLRQKYQSLRRSRSLGKIDESKFIDEVNQLRCEDENGNWWQIDSETGEWLTWNGNDWLPGNPVKSGQSKKRSSDSADKGEKRYRPGSSTGSEQQVASAAELPGLISIGWGSLLRLIFSSLFGRLRIMITVGIMAFLLHTFLIAVGNNGYDKDSNISSMFSQLRSYNSTIFSGQLPWFINYTIGDFKVGSNIAIKRNEVPATAGWTLGGALLLLAWRGFRTRGLFGGFTRILSLPRQVCNNCSPHLGVNLAGLALGIFIANYFSGKLPHQSQNMLSFISLGAVGSMVPLAFASVLARICHAAGAAIKTRIFRNVGFAGLSQVLFLGLSCGMFANSVWQYGSYVGWGLAIYTVFLIITRPGKALPVSGRATMFFNIFAVGGLMYFLCDQAAHAHDKGWWENVNSNDPLTKQIVSWVKAPGSAELMKAGVPPSVGAAVGAGAVDAATSVTTYVLQVSAHHLQVSPEAPGELLVAVWKSEEGGALVPAGDASISISGSAPWLSLSASSGTCRLNCIVGQRPESTGAQAPLESVTLTITGIGGGQTCSSTVVITPGGQPQYVLEVF